MVLALTGIKFQRFWDKNSQSYRQTINTEIVTLLHMNFKRSNDLIITEEH